MSKAVTTFVLAACLAAFLMELSIGIARYGYPAGALAQARISGLVEAANFLPLAALYFIAAFLTMVLPLRAAGFVLVNGAEAIFWCVVVLFGTAAGVTLVRWGFGERAALDTLVDGHHLFVALIAASHLSLSAIRRNAWLRALFALASLALTALTLLWTFRF